MLLVSKVEIPKVGRGFGAGMPTPVATVLERMVVGIGDIKLGFRRRPGILGLILLLRLGRIAVSVRNVATARALILRFGSSKGGIEPTALFTVVARQLLTSCFTPNNLCGG